MDEHDVSGVIRGRSHSAHAVRRCALVVFSCPRRKVVVKVVATFEDDMAAGSFAADQGWRYFAVAPAYLVLPAAPTGFAR